MGAVCESDGWCAEGVMSWSIVGRLGVSRGCYIVWAVIR